MKRVDLNQRTEEWRAWRKCGITATDSSVILGLNPERTSVELWFEKTGRTEPEDISYIPAVRYGVEHEDMARSLWEIEHETLAPPICGEWDENPIFRASFDGLTAENEVLEIKCPLPNGSTLLDVKVRREESDAYRLYWWQVQHQLLVSGAQKGYLIFLDNDSLIEFEIVRDESAIERIVKEGSEFFASLQGDKPPLDSSLWSPQTEEQATAWNEAASLYLTAQKQMKELRQQQDAARKKMKVLMGNHTKADLAGVKVVRTLAKSTLSLPKIASRLQELGYEITADMLNACQGEASERWTFTESVSASKEAVAVAAAPPKPKTNVIETEIEIEPELDSEQPVTWF